MPDKRKETGNHGESLAASYLLGQGYEIIANNWRCAVGEVDLVAKDAEALIFVEVRTRRSARLGTPEESVTPAKQAKLIALAETYLTEHHCSGCDWRIDVIAIVLDRRNQISRLNHIKWAVDGY